MGFFFSTSHTVAEGYAQSLPYELQVIRNEYQDLADQVGTSDDEALWQRFQEAERRYEQALAEHEGRDSGGL